VRAGTFAAGAAALFVLLSAAVPGHTQTTAPPLPLPGFVPPYEITRIVRSVGFEPLAPPLREGTTYVVRVTDFRGILMRVVVDAHSGALRAVNRIVTGPEPYGPIGMLPPPYGVPPPYGPPDPPEFVAPEGAPAEDSATLPQPPAAPLPSGPPTLRPAAHALRSAPPPLPRPRPAEFASRKAADGAKPAVQPPSKPAAAPAPVALPAAAATPKKPPAPAALPD
jgi:hypothetical protein